MPETDSGLSERLRCLRSRLGRVQLLAVSKGQPTDRILEAIRLGQRDFAENYLQEASARMAQLEDASTALCWHFTGRLQRNKTARIGELFAWVHSLHRPEMAERLIVRRDSAKPLNVLLQIRHPTQADHRAGVSEDLLEELVEATVALPGLRLRGLMCMASPEPDRAKAEFAATRTLFDELQGKYPAMDTLSMGTSADWRLAVASGSTMVRIGQALFGPRTYRKGADG